MTETHRREFLKASGAAALAIAGTGAVAVAGIDRARAAKAIWEAGALTANEVGAELSASWQDELRRKISALGERAWRLAPAQFGVSQRWAKITVECSRQLVMEHNGNLIRAIGCVNEKPLASMSAGLIMLQGADTDERCGMLDFAVRRSLPWNSIEIAVPGRRSIRREFAYNGQPLHQLFDFDTIR